LQREGLLKEAPHAPDAHGDVRAAPSILVCACALLLGLAPGAQAQTGGGALALSPDTPGTTAQELSGEYVFPIAGGFDWGGRGARFGARRSGHRHQGQDLTAARGTPLVAPHAGTVEVVRFQRAGAGHYVVIDGDAEDRDYVFMHLRRGSIPVRPGDALTAGEQIGQVGSSGASSGPHLHFEIWVGGWYDGGRPIDPLPLLRDWAGL
jgi:murein DD-endopeptidase MepM/ murein hydrolase activator NlpD